MGYIGNQTSNSFTSMDKQSITGNGTTGPYTLTYAVANEQEIEVFVNNVRQEPGVAYTVSGNAMTMTGNVAAADDFYVVFQGKAIQTTVPGDDTITAAMLKDGVVTSAKIAAGTVTAADLASTLDLSSKTITGIPVTNEFAQYTRYFGANVDGDAASAGWNTVGLNSEVSDTIGASISSSQITLPAGTYFVTGFCQAYECNRTGARLRDTANSVTLLTGGGGWSSASYNGLVLAYLSGQMTLASSTSFYFQVYAGNAGRLGLRPASGESWQQSGLNIWKIA